MHVVYTGNRVRIRPFVDLAEANLVLDEDYALPDPFRGPRWYALSERKTDFEKLGFIDSSSYSTFAIELIETSEVVGISGGSGSKPGVLAVNIGTYILAENRGQGYGIEAKQLMLCRMFECFQVDAVRASTMEHHASARASLEACGMNYFGKLRAIEFTKGRYYDEVQYEIFREEWEKLTIREIVKRGN